MISIYLMLTITYVAGAVIAVYADFGFAVIFSVCMLVIVGLKCMLKLSEKNKLFCCIFLLLGTVLMSNSWYADSKILSGCEGRYVEVQGVVVELPGVYDGYYSYTVRLEQLDYRDLHEPIKDTIHVTSEMQFDTGNRLKLRGFLREIDGPDNSTEFDYRLYYKSKGILYRMHAEEAELVAARAVVISPAYAGNYIKSRICFAIDKFFSGDSAALMKSVLLGCKSGFSDTFRKMLVKTSAMRFLHPSYLHMFLIISICEFCFVFTSRRKRELIIIAALVIYAVFNSDFNTFTRLILLFALMTVYRRIRGFSHYPDLISIVILALLIANPMLLTASWFVMSISMGIMQYIFFRPVSERLVFIRNKAFRSVISVWLIGTVGVMPLSAYYFYGASFYSIIFTLFYTPLSLILFIISPITLCMYELFGGANLLGVICDAILRLMKNIPQLVAMLPGYYVMLGKTTVIGFIIFILLAAMIKLYLERRYNEKSFIAAAIVCFSLITGQNIQAIADRGNLYAYFVNVGQGDGAVINISGKDTILIDGGGASADNTYNVGEDVFVPYLSAKGFYNIELAIVSHSHSDHIEGIIAAVENCRIHTVMLPDIDEKSEYRKRLIEAAQKNDTEIIYADEGDRLDFESGLVIEVLSPIGSIPISDENNASLVLKLTYGETTMFFGGDAGKDIERQLQGKLGQIDIVKASHHGSKTSSSQEFIDEVSPELVVFSVGKNNMYGHPNEDVVNRFSDSGAEIMRTDKMGDIVVKANKSGIIEVRKFKEDS